MCLSVVDLQASNRNIRLACHSLDLVDIRLILLWTIGMIKCLETCTSETTGDHILRSG